MTLIATYTIICDGCGTEYDGSDASGAKVKAWAREDGWTMRTRLPGAGSNHVKGDICPDCLALRMAAPTSEQPDG